MGIRTSVIGSGAINMRIEEKKPAPCLAGRWSLMPTNCVVSCSILVTPEGIIQAKSTTLAFFFFNFFNVYLFLRERDTLSGSGGGAERETQNPKQALGSEMSAQSPMQGSHSQTMRS